MRKRTTTLGIVLALALGGSLAVARGWPGVRLEPTKTWVGVARVHLEVSELIVVGNVLVGTYEIRVPLAPARDDRGTVRFELGGTLEQAVADGGVLRGLGQSLLDHRTHVIRCAFGEDDSVRIDIDSGDRRLSFRSRWTPGA